MVPVSCFNAFQSLCRASTLFVSSTHMVTLKMVLQTSGGPLTVAFIHFHWYFKPQTAISRSMFKNNRTPFHSKANLASEDGQTSHHCCTYNKVFTSIILSSFTTTLFVVACRMIGNVEPRLKSRTVMFSSNFPVVDCCNNSTNSFCIRLITHLQNIYKTHTITILIFLTYQDFGLRSGEI